MYYEKNYVKHSLKENRHTLVIKNLNYFLKIGIRFFEWAKLGKKIKFTIFWDYPSNKFYFM